MDTDKKLKFFIWGGFALITSVILAWPVVKLITKGSSRETSFSGDSAGIFTSGRSEGSGVPGAEGVPALPMPLRYQSPARYSSGAGSSGYNASRQGAAEPAAPSGYDSGREEQDEQDSGRQREADFIREHAREIRAYHIRLNTLGLKYMAKYPALRKMDAEFARLDRYMALKRQYERDLNAYNFARGVTTLPEVRNAIIRYSANPDVVLALVAATMEAVKNPPPQAIQAEIAHFFAEEPKVTTYVNDVLVQAMGNAMPTISSIPGKDLATLQKLGSGVMGGNTLNKR